MPSASVSTPMSLSSFVSFFHAALALGLRYAGIRGIPASSFGSFLLSGLLPGFPVTSLSAVGVVFRPTATFYLTTCSNGDLGLLACRFHRRQALPLCSPLLFWCYRGNACTAVASCWYPKIGIGRLCGGSCGPLPLRR